MIDPYKERTADDGVPDVKLMQMRQRDNFGNVGVVNTMSRINNEAEIMPQFGTPAQPICGPKVGPSSAEAAR